MASDNRQPFGQCRCCLDFGYHKDISQPYFRNGVRQVYRETFLESFNLHLSTNKYLSNMICKSCIRKLNNASDFKALVVETERQLLSRIQCTSDLVTVSQHKTSFVEEEVKDAVIKKEEDDDWNNDGDEINPQDDIEEWAVSDGPSTSSQTLIKNLAPCFVKLEQLNEAQDKVKLNANVIERKNDSQAGDKLNVTSRGDMKHIADVVEETCSLIHNITKKLKTIETKCPNKKINRNTGLSAVGLKATTIKTAHKNKPSAAVNNKPRPDKGDNVIAAKNEKTDTASECNKDNTRKNQAPQISLKPSFNGSLGNSPHTKRRRKQRPKRTYVCDKCAYTTAGRSCFVNHLKIHQATRIKPFTCNICNSKFPSSSGLLAHGRKHTGEKPFSCEVCGKSFIQISILKRHLRIHSGEKPYACTTCGKRFTQKASLSAHIRIHTGEKPYACKFCDAKFAQRHNLTCHVRTHTGEKPHACIICDKRFISSSDVTKHMKKHTGEIPYSCHTCNEVLSSSTDLRKHLDTHISEVKNFS